MSNRLNVTFRNKEIIDKIADEAMSQSVTKSELIESVMREYLDEKNIKINGQVEKYLSNGVGINYFIKDNLVDNDNYLSIKASDVLMHKNCKISFSTNSISILELNKLYLKKVVENLTYEARQICKNYLFDGIFCVVLVRDVNLLSRSKLNYDVNKINASQKVKIKNKKYFYEFDISYTLIKVGKIIVEYNLERKNPTYHLQMFSGNDFFISTKLFERIDFSSIEYRTPKESEILSMKKSKRTCDYYQLTPMVTSYQKGDYYVKFANKAKSFNQYLKKINYLFVKRSFFCQYITN